MSDNTPLESSLSQTAGTGSIQYQAGRDLIVNNNIEKDYNQYLKLVSEFEKELQAEPAIYKNIIDKIRHFTSNVDGNTIIELETKLTTAGFASDYKWARQMKHQYAKKITENDLSKATQKIHAFLLAKICVLFNMHIRAAINEGVSKENVREMIMEKVITPIQNMIGEDNVLDLYDDDLVSMMYFLTGNCHINWK